MRPIVKLVETWAAECPPHQVHFVFEGTIKQTSTPDSTEHSEKIDFVINLVSGEGLAQVAARLEAVAHRMRGELEGR